MFSSFNMAGLNFMNSTFVFSLKKHTLKKPNQSTNTGSGLDDDLIPKPNEKK